MLSIEDNELITRTGRGTPMGELLRRFWMPALMADELPGPDSPPVQFKLLGENLVAWRGTDGHVGVLDEWCPHRRTSLFYGRNEENGLRCVYHGWKFDRTGACVDMPNEPAEYDFKRKVRITAYPARDYGGLIWIYMGPPDKMAELPALEWALLPPERRVALKWFQECNYFQAMEGDVDSSHVSFLHSAFGGVPRLDPNDDPGMNRSLPTEAFADRAPYFTVREADSGLVIAARRDAGAADYYWRITQWLPPFFSMIPGAPGSSIACTFRVPVDDESTFSFTVRWHLERPFSEAEAASLRARGPELIPGTWQSIRNRRNHHLIDRQSQKESSFTGIKGAHPQDSAIAEAMGAIADRSLERLGPADSGVIAVRKHLIRAARDLQQGIEPRAAANGSLYGVRSAALNLPHGVDFMEGARQHLLAGATAQS